MAEVIEKGLGEGLEALRVEETARLAYARGPTIGQGTDRCARRRR